MSCGKIHCYAVKDITLRRERNITPCSLRKKRNDPALAPLPAWLSSPCSVIHSRWMRPRPKHFGADHTRMAPFPSYLRLTK